VTKDEAFSREEALIGCIETDEIIVPTGQRIPTQTLTEACSALSSFHNYTVVLASWVQVLMCSCICYYLELIYIYIIYKF